jgi:aminobenzoyl-glutamate utilization protein B
MHDTEEIWRLVDAHQEDFIRLSDRVWEMPELCYTEFRSCADHTSMLETKGFRGRRHSHSGGARRVRMVP